MSKRTYEERRLTDIERDVLRRANAYPELVAALQSLLAEPTSLFTRDAARALLAKLEAA